MDSTKAQQLFERLRAARPKPTTELRYRSPFELLVAVILSAQATDKKVNEATEPLFRLANTPQALLALGEAKLKDSIKTIGLYNMKAANIRKTCTCLLYTSQAGGPSRRAGAERAADRSA